MKPFLRDAFAHILEGIKVPNKVMSGYVDECILSIIRYTVFKTGIITIATEVKENKAKVVREKCLVRYCVCYLSCLIAVNCCILCRTI